MAVTPAQVIAIATEHAAIATATIQTFIDISERRLSRPVVGDEEKADDMIIFLTAHYLTLFVKQGAMKASALASVRIGPVTRSFAAGASSASALGTTPWGAHFLELKATIFVPRVL